MRTRRTPDAAWSETAARRLAQLTADLGAVPPAVGGSEARPGTAPPAAPEVADDWWADHTRVAVPVASRAPTLPGAPAARRPPEPVERPAERAAVAAHPSPGAAPVTVPRPGRHASRRARGFRPVRQLPRLGPAQVAVVAVLVAVGLAVAAWWVVQQRAEPLPPGTAAGAAPLVPLDPSAAATTDGSAGSAGSAGTGATATGATGQVTVDVTGKVRRPGIVVLDAGARVVDALEAAGGARRGVDLSSLNLARLLVDGEQVVVGLDPVTGPAVPSPTAGGAGAGPTTLVNINLASEAELETLPEVGPVTAAAIVAWREQHGGFTAVDELLEVDGIGEVTLQKLSPYVTV